MISSLKLLIFSENESSWDELFCPSARASLTGFVLSWEPIEISIFKRMTPLAEIVNGKSKYFKSY